MNQSKFEANACFRRQARENTCEQVSIGLNFVFHWLKKLYEFWQPIIERGKEKPKQTKTYFRQAVENENRSICRK